MPPGWAGGEGYKHAVTSVDGGTIRREEKIDKRDVTKSLQLNVSTIPVRYGWSSFSFQPFASLFAIQTHTRARTMLVLQK